MTHPNPLPGRFSSWTDLLSSVESNDGVLQVTMETLRQLEGAQRLGVNVLSTIDDRLSALGFGHLPLELPTKGQSFVVVYRVGTPAADTIDALREGITTAGQSSYEAMRRLNATTSSLDADKAEELQEEVEDLRHKAARVSHAVMEIMSESQAVDTSNLKKEVNGQRKESSV